MTFATLDDDLGDALAQIAEALQVPVLALAVIVLIAVALELGRFAQEVWQRRRSGGPRALRTQTEAAMVRGAGANAAGAPSRPAAVAVAGLVEAAAAGQRDRVDDALADYELTVQRRLDRTRVLVRAGPAVGLMGTLIPLAPGLTALGNGHVAELASDLRTAFAATVVGLLAGTVAFALTLTRTRMYSEDLNALERAAAAWSRRAGMLQAPVPGATR
jgi:biopolymer transport protein ExbB/TolQ